MLHPYKMILKKLDEIGKKIVSLRKDVRRGREQIGKMRDQKEISEIRKAIGL